MLYLSAVFVTPLDGKHFKRGLQGLALIVVVAVILHLAHKV